LVKAEEWERASIMAKLVTERLKEIIEKEAFSLLKEGKSKEEIRKQLKLKHVLA